MSVCLSVCLKANNGKLECILVKALMLCTSRTSHSGSRGIHLLFIENGTRRREGSTLRTGRFLTLGKESVPNVQEAGWPQGPVWTSAEILVPKRNTIPIPTSTGS